MSRTPLYRQLRRSMHLARVSLITGETATEVVDRAAAARIAVRAARAEAATRDAAAREVGLASGKRAGAGAGALWSRRGFLGCSAGAASTLLLGACARPLQRIATGSREPVIIVGAGVAGLVAAYRLRQAQVPVRLFEAQSRVGGRMFSLRDSFADGQVVELGGELIDTGHTAIRELAAELDVVLDDVSVEPADIAHETWFFGGARRTTPEIVAALRPVAARMDADLRRLGDPDVTWRSRGAAVALDRMTLSEWLDAAGVSGWIRSLIEVSYTTEYGLEPGQQSSLNLLTMLSPDPFQIFGESDERFHAHEGNDRITQRLAERVDDTIETGTVLESVRAVGGRRYTVTLRRDGSTIEATSPHVLLAIPFTMLRRVQLDVRLPAQQRRAIQELDYGTNAKLMIGFSERTWRERHRSSGSSFSDLAYQTTWETSRGQAGRAGVLTNFTGGRNGAQLGSGTAAQQAARTVDALEQVYPGVAAARDGMREARFHWPSHEWTHGSYACFSPGQWTAFRGLIGAPAGGVHFIGEHASMEAQGFMEGGCETGELAARSVLRELRLAGAPLTRRALLRA
jgi:monoamine oxidase